MLKASCTWGYGPDILVTNEGNPYMLYDEPVDKHRAVHGYSYNGSFDLSVKEAKRLVSELEMAIKYVEELEQNAKEYFKKDDSKNETKK